MSLRDEHWDVEFRGVTVWPYLRFNYQDKKVTAYRKDFHFQFSALLIPFLLAIKSGLFKRPVVSVVARPALLDYVRSEFVGEDFLLISRSEQIVGNSLLVESVWFLFRKLAWWFVRSEYEELCHQLDSKGIDARQHEADLKIAIGDYFYNFFISFFVRGRVYYTNCLVPKIERYMGLMDSVEVQHGIIHSGHMDYANIDGRYIKNSLLVWSDRWADRLRSIGYGGHLIVANHDFITVDEQLKRDGITVFTTVENNFSCMIDSYKGSLELRLQRHPRDYFCYSNGLYKYVVGAEKQTAFAICHDTTLIFYFIKNSVFFVYLMTGCEKEDDVVNRLREKYDAILGEDYLVSTSLDDAIIKIERWAGDII